MKTPPFLLAMALLFWGWQTDQIILAIPLALTLEGSRFLPTRFELSPLEFNRVWNLCLLAFVILIVTIYVSKKGLGSIYIILQWIPLVLSPMMAAQLYSIEGKVPTVSFKIFYRGNEAGKDGPAIKRVNLLYPYLAVCIFAASAAGDPNNWFYWGMCLLCAWAFWGVRSKRFSGITWSASLALIVLLGFWGGQGLFQLRNYIDSQVIDWLTKRFQSEQNPFKTRTAIGEIVELKMDDTILYHVDYEKGRLKKILLPQATYNVYKDSAWYASRSKFIELASASETQWVFEGNFDAEKIIRVSMDLHKGRGLLLAPNQALRLDNLPVLYLATNSLGTLRAEKGPEFLEYQVALHNAVSRNSAPSENDLRVPEELQPVLQKIADDLKLADKSPDGILKTVDQYFENRFSYTLNLTRGETNIPPLVDFLTRTRKGHCEYFATAAVLLLRQAGIPARYTFGYSAHEYNWLQENLVVRSRDAHAWAIAYVNGRWQNFDTTPPIWVDQQADNASALEVIADVWSQMGFLLSHFRWGMEDESYKKYLVWLLIPPILFLVWRIYSRTRRVQQAAGTGESPSAALYRGLTSDFHLIESRLNQLGFTREEWETYSRWLRRIHREHPEAPINGLAEAIALHSRQRFDPQGLTSEEDARLKTEIQSWLQTPQ